jgi:hypothetical protein
VARTIGEIGDQLRHFDEHVKGYFAKHKRRCSFLQAHRKDVSRVVGFDISGYRMESAIVTNTIVPLQFLNDLPFPKDKIVAVQQLSRLV